MLLIGVDYHPSFQQVAFLNMDTGECGELQLNHSHGEAETSYSSSDLRDLRKIAYVIPQNNRIHWESRFSTQWVLGFVL